MLVSGDRADVRRPAPEWRLIGAGAGMMRRLYRRLAGLVLAALLLVGAPAGVWAQEFTTLQDFFGNYVGQSISLADQGLNERDLAVSIKPFHENGFTLDWTTISR